MLGSIKERRIKMGFTQKELALKAGISLATMKRWEKRDLHDRNPENELLFSLDDPEINKKKLLSRVLDSTSEEQRKAFRKFAHEYAKENNIVIVVHDNSDSYWSITSKYDVYGPKITIIHLYLYSNEIQWTEVTYAKELSWDKFLEEMQTEWELYIKEYIRCIQIGEVIK